MIFKKQIFNRLLVLLIFFGCTNRHPLQIDEIAVDKQMINEAILPDTAIESMILPYRVQLDAEMNEVIGFSRTGLVNPVPKSESPLGNFVADAIHKMTLRKTGKSVDLALINSYGGLRVSLDSGNITRGRIFELMPFENEILILSLNGHELQEVFDISAKSMRNSLSNSRYTVDRNRASNILVSNQPLSSTKVYTLAISDYLANGGGGFHLLKDLPRERADYKVRDAIIDYIILLSKEKKSIDQQAEGRVIMAE